MTDVNLMIGVGAVLLNLVTVVVGVTWSVSKVKGSVDQVAGAVQSLNITVTRLEASLNEAHRKTNQHEVEIEVLKDRATRIKCPFSTDKPWQPQAQK